MLPVLCGTCPCSTAACPRVSPSPSRFGRANPHDLGQTRNGLPEVVGSPRSMGLPCMGRPVPPCTGGPARTTQVGRVVRAGGITKLVGAPSWGSPNTSRSWGCHYGCAALARRAPPRPLHRTAGVGSFARAAHASPERACGRDPHLLRKCCMLPSHRITRCVPRPPKWA